MIDLGADVPIEQFVEAAKEHKAELVSISALMTTTMTNMGKVIEILQEEGIRDAMKVMVGGAPVSEEFAIGIGADSTHADAMHASAWASEAVKELDPKDVRWSEEKINLGKIKYREVLAKKVVSDKVDIGLETANLIKEEFESIGVKSKEEMTHIDRTISAMSDKKVDRLPVYPLACGVLRKFAGVNYRDYATKAEAFTESASLAVSILTLICLWALLTFQRHPQTSDVKSNTLRTTPRPRKDT